jgi:CRP-like cAMP-binding protein
LQGTTITDALRRVPPFAQLSDEQFASVERGSEVWLRPGEVLVKEGNPPLGFFVQLEGQTEWTRRFGQQEVYVLTPGPGVFYGHELLLTDKPHPKEASRDVGLGLGIARGTVRRPGDDIRVDSRPGRITFTVRLPISLPDSGRAAP